MSAAWNCPDSTRSSTASSGPCYEAAASPSIEAAAGILTRWGAHGGMDAALRADENGVAGPARFLNHGRRAGPLTARQRPGETTPRYFSARLFGQDRPGGWLRTISRAPSIVPAPSMPSPRWLTRNMHRLRSVMGAGAAQVRRTPRLTEFPGCPAT